MPDETTPPDRDVVLIPVFNDWTSCALLLGALAEVLRATGTAAEVLVVDDGSTEPVPAGWPGTTAPEHVSVLSLRGNVGHQRAIAIGLSHLQAAGGVRRVVVMDGDGEDDPADVPRLLAASEGEGRDGVVFAERTRRGEGPVFRLGYAVYRYAHLVLTGLPVKFGNFSVVSASALDRLVVSSDLWNHYAATVVKARVPYRTIPTARARRLAGRTRMNWVGLVVHGLSAMAVFADRIGVRLLLSSLLLTGLAVLGTGAAVAASAFTDWAVPGWAGVASAALGFSLLLGVLMFVVFVLITLGGRGNAAFLPIRDHVHFVRSVRAVRK